MAKIDPSELLFSDEDNDLLQYKWRTCKDGYARRSPRLAEDPKCIPILAHHEVCQRAFGRKPDWSKHEVVDHINGNRLDNRRENLRIVLNGENRIRGRLKGYIAPAHGGFQLYHNKTYIGWWRRREDAVKARTEYFAGHPTYEIETILEGHAQ